MLLKWWSGSPNLLTTSFWEREIIFHNIKSSKYVALLIVPDIYLCKLNFCPNFLVKGID